MDESPRSELDPNDDDIELLVDTLRKCFDAEKARYFVNQGTLIIEISGLNELSQSEITEVAEPVLEELDPGFDEILLLEM